MCMRQVLNVSGVFFDGRKKESENDFQNKPPCVRQDYLLHFWIE